MHVLCVVPARIGSSRLAQKPLRLIAGEPLVRCVARRVLGFDLGARVVVATDDPRVGRAVAGLPVETLLTSPDLASGTERAAAVLAQLDYPNHEIILNLQGDEPLIEREAVLGALERVTRRGDDIGTAAGPLGPGALGDPNRVKVVVDGRGRALAFFRTPQAPGCARRDAIFQHLGVYAYRAHTLRRWVALPPTAEERDDRLEQLRPLGYGMTVGVAVQQVPVAPGVDTEADIQEIERWLAA
ncbi:MAG: 3-deoxy-manno-octulosonate cytidylyltransferase [Gemmatimonadetes bacterium]|nr:3-deoxy-manno-octulosonate cytidylyltransferase [Gemmatimonadota bacterium]